MRLRRAILVAATAACTSSAEPDLPADESGVYALRSIADAPLPYRLGPDPDALVVVADTLFVQGPGRGQVRQRLVRDVPPTGTRSVVDVEGSYTRSGARLELSFVRRTMICTLGQRGGRATLDCPFPGTNDAWVYTR
jgi:hypothetical protein